MEIQIKQKKKPNRKRSETLHLQLTKEEKETIVNSAAVEEITKTELVLKAITFYLENAPEELRGPKEPEEEEPKKPKKEKKQRKQRKSKKKEAKED